MKRITIIIISFCTGVIAGIAGAFFYQLFGKPVLPKPEYDGWAEAFKPKVEKCKLEFEHLYPLEDTQPVQVRSWDMDYQMGEMLHE